jgi:hypothetical protein
MLRVYFHAERKTIMNDEEEYDWDEAASEGREFLKIATDVDEETIETYDDLEITSWLEEMDYEWNGQSWVAT